VVKRRQADSDLEVADYCIVGAGPAGCVLANRLSEDGRSRVVLLEAGPRDWHPYLHIPATCLLLYRDQRFNWHYRSEPEPTLNDLPHTISQGKVLGGSSSINGMLHVRGDPGDFDSWSQMGCDGWGYTELLPYFCKAERYEGELANKPDLRGRDGFHIVSDFSAIHPLTRAFVKAAEEIGMPYNPDMNGETRDGVAYYQQNRSGRFRSQPAQTYLRAARRRPNLSVKTEATCTRILFDSKRAVGIQYWSGDRLKTVRAQKEVILSAGAFRSPQLLHVSGIGSSETLSSVGITPVVENRSVGENLRDHFQVRVAQRVKGVVTLNERTRGLAFGKELLKYLAFASGLLTMGASTAAAFFRSDESKPYPDAQLMFAPGSFAGPGVLETEPGMTIGSWPSRPRSRGRVFLRSADVREPPAIQLNYLSDEEDRRIVVECVRRSRKIFASGAMAQWSVRETLPGPGREGFDEVLDYARQQGGSGMHFVGTCRMGSDGQAVVDPQLRVIGTDGLRVVDASVMPNCTLGNPNASIVAIAEKAADLILGKPAPRMPSHMAMPA
jgi:choline dehydrogenase